MTAHLTIADGAYVLEQDVVGERLRLATLPGGAGALLPPARGVGAAALEGAIEVAEDWLMPHAAGLRGAFLDVVDLTGRLRSGLDAVLGVQAGDGLEWSVAEVEGLFLRLVDLATGRAPSPLLQQRHAFAADLLLLRELAHHGQVRALRLRAGS